MGWYGGVTSQIALLALFSPFLFFPPLLSGLSLQAPHHQRPLELSFFIGSTFTFWMPLWWHPTLRLEGGLKFYPYTCMKKTTESLTKKALTLGMKWTPPGTLETVKGKRPCPSTQSSRLTTTQGWWNWGHFNKNWVRASSSPVLEYFPGCDFTENIGPYRTTWGNWTMKAAQASGLEILVQLAQMRPLWGRYL